MDTKPTHTHLERTLFEIIEIKPVHVKIEIIKCFQTINLLDHKYMKLYVYKLFCIHHFVKKYKNVFNVISCDFVK